VLVLVAISVRGNGEELEEGGWGGVRGRGQSGEKQGRDRKRVTGWRAESEGQKGGGRG